MPKEIHPLKHEYGNIDCNFISNPLIMKFMDSLINMNNSAQNLCSILVL